MVSAGRRVAFLGLMSAVALILFVFEAAVPRPLPWMKLGLGNAAVLATLLLFGGAPAIAVGAVKVLVGGLLIGGLAGPASVIGGSAALTSLATMIGLHRFLPRLLSPVGLSVAGAVVHQATQLLVAEIYLAQAGLLRLLPLFLVGGVLSGAMTGLVTYFAVRALMRAGHGSGPAAGG